MSTSIIMSINRIKTVVTYTLISGMLLALGCRFFSSSFSEFLHEHYHYDDAYPRETIVHSNLKLDVQDKKIIDVLSSDGDFESGICSDTILKDPYYRKLMDDYFRAWYKLVPPQSKMDSSNCWYTENFNTLPTKLTIRMKRLLNFHGFQDKYSPTDIDAIFNTLFSKDKMASFSTKPSNHHFCLPNVNLIGFPKTGSTFLYECIRSHPLLAEPRSKEGHFWIDIIATKDQQYLELAALLYLYRFFDASRQIRNSPDMFTIDASISAVFATSKPLREVEKDVCLVPMIVSKTMPKIKLLVITRNPISRLWSDFLYFCPPKIWNGQENLRTLEKTPLVVASLFHNYTVTALQEFRACIESGHTQFHCTALAGSYPGQEASCKKLRLGISMYYVHLIKWFHIFPREQLHVTRLEDLVSDPSSTMDKVWDFLGVPPYTDFQAMNKKVKANKWSIQQEDGENFEMFPKTRKLLGEFFHPYNVRLAELLDNENYLWTET